MAAAKRPMFKPARMTANKTSNIALTQKVVEARAKVDQARAKANLVEAQIEVKGKKVVYDWNHGVETVKVVDAPKVN